MDYTSHYNRRETPQAEPIPGKPMVENSAGGYAFAVDDWTRLDRFLLLGSEGGTYYIGERRLTRENAEAVERCIRADGPRTVARIAEVSEAGRAPKNDPALFALALAAACGDDNTRSRALAALPRVARIGTHLFRFAHYAKALRGWGRGLRAAVADWYLRMELDRLALQLVKYQRRDGWSHRDLLRLAHPTPRDEERAALLRWAVKGEIAPKGEASEWLARALSVPAEPTAAAAYIRAHRLPREVVPTELLRHAAVWEALLDSMPMGAMVRNLGVMTNIGLLRPMSAAARTVAERLVDPERLRAARVHPIAVLSALKVYAQGRGDRGSLSWTPAPEVLDALDRAFELAFEGVEPTGQRFVLGLDVSGSMDITRVVGLPALSCREAAAAMAMVPLRREPACATIAFSTQVVPLPLSGRMRLDDVVQRTRGLPFGGTDCARPMLWALEQGIEADLFVVYTDSETWAGSIHPAQALQRYRERTGIPAKLAVMGMASNGFSIADPADAGMLDCVGLDASTPAVLQEFASGPKV